MEEIIELLTSDPGKAIDYIYSGAKVVDTVKEHRQEYTELRRDIRKTQIANTQKDKNIPRKGNRAARTVPAVRIPIPFQKKIVQTATAFEVGEQVLLNPIPPGELSKEIERIWNLNRIDNKIQKLVETKKSETEAAIMFYIQDIDPTKAYNRTLGPNDQKEIKCIVRTSKEGRVGPYFDEYGDMKLFAWSYSVKKGDKETKHVQIYSDDKVWKLSDEEGGKMAVVTAGAAHGFNKIPVVYVSQDNPEWYDVQEMIDRYETSMSKLGGSNDYSGHPLLKLYGDVKSMPDKNDDGKTLVFPIKELKDGKEIKGDAEFLTNNNAAESVKLELDKLENLIYSLSSTPQLSYSDLKGLGAISGIAIKLMFLDAIIKTKLNEGDNRTMVERIINVLISGIVTTTVVGYKEQAKNLLFDVQFQSIIPTDLDGIITYLARGVEAGFISQDTAIKETGLVEDLVAEKKLITDAKALDTPPTEPAPGSPPEPAPPAQE